MNLPNDKVPVLVMAQALVVDIVASNDQASSHFGDTTEIDMKRIVLVSVLRKLNIYLFVNFTKG